MVRFLCGGIRASRAYDDRAYTAEIRMVAVIILALLYVHRMNKSRGAFFFFRPLNSRTANSRTLVVIFAALPFLSDCFALFSFSL